MLQIAFLRPKSLTQNATHCCKMLRSKSRHKKCHSVFLGENHQKNIFGFGTGSAFIYGIRKKESDENGKGYPY
jgi:hypothetical protein